MAAGLPDEAAVKPLKVHCPAIQRGSAICGSLDAVLFGNIYLAVRYADVTCPECRDRIDGAVESVRANVARMRDGSGDAP